MTVRMIKLSDVGEGVAEAELVAWHVAVGDRVEADAPLAEVMTDKATVEISSPVAGVVTQLNGEPGDTVAVGSELVGIDVSGGGSIASAPAPATLVSEAPPPPAASAPTPEPVPAPAPPPRAAPAPPRRAAPEGERPLAAPSVRRRALDAGVNLRLVSGSGPAGRITHSDLDAYIAGERPTSTRRGPAAPPTESRLVGLRRRIAEKMTLSASSIPHITYVDEVDMTELEKLRGLLNERPDAPRLTVLPFVIKALTIAIAEHPNVNATFDSEAGVLTTFGQLDVGIATQTEDGLVVPVVRDAGRLGLRACATEIARVSDLARSGKAARDDLTGSTITITSLGALGGLVTTPIINHPEVAIIGINKMQIRPVWNPDGQSPQFVPRTMMNLSSSFDHRIIDGWDAATFVQRIRQLLETPALLFVGED
jgi:2-oxoisovalerate dehydrogenase E2 component (dihydrolipoyl transacylase)